MEWGIIVGVWDIIVIVGIVLLVVGLGLFFLNKWAGKRMAAQQDMVERNKTTADIYVIDKKKDKLSNANLPKAVTSQVPKWSRFMKVPLVKAKIGPQIMTLICEGKVFSVLPVKKTVKVEIAGLYIVGMKGMKTKREMAAMRMSRKGIEAPTAKPSFFSRFKK